MFYSIENFITPFGYWNKVGWFYLHSLSVKSMVKTSVLHRPIMRERKASLSLKNKFLLTNSKFHLRSTIISESSPTTTLHWKQGCDDSSFF